MESPQAIPEDPEVQPSPPQPPEMDAKPPRFAEVHFGTQNRSILTQDKTGLLMLCFFPLGSTFLKEPHQKLSGKMKLQQLIPLNPHPFQPPKNLERFGKVTMER